MASAVLATTLVTGRPCSASSARAAISPKAWEEGNPEDLVVMGPSTAHYSILRALSIMGMGKKAFKPIPVDELMLTWQPTEWIVDSFGAKGASVLLAGDKGSGKSVLLKCLIGVLKPSFGKILIKDKNFKPYKSTSSEK